VLFLFVIGATGGTGAAIVEELVKRSIPVIAGRVVAIAMRDHAYGQEWNTPGAGTISRKEIVRLSRVASGSAKPVIPLGRISLSISRL